MLSRCCSYSAGYLAVPAFGPAHSDPVADALVGWLTRIQPPGRTAFDRGIADGSAAPDCVASVDGRPRGCEAAAATARATSWRAELRAFGIIALLIVLILVTGIIPAVFLFTGGYFVLTRHYSWLMGLVYTSVFTASVYVLFVFALQIQPYHGMAAPLIERFQ